MNLIRTIRRSAGLGVRECARRVGIAHARISEYESGSHEPTLSRVQNIASSSGIRLVPIPISPSAVTAAEIADEIYEQIRSDEPLRKQVRLVLQLNDDLAAAPDFIFGALVATPPPATGDRRFDAFIAGLVEWHATRLRLPIPPWVNEAERITDPVWKIDPHTNSEDAIKELAQHGVIVGKDELVNA